MMDWRDFGWPRTIAVGLVVAVLLTAFVVLFVWAGAIFDSEDVAMAVRVLLVSLAVVGAGGVCGLLAGLPGGRRPAERLYQVWRWIAKQGYWQPVAGPMALERALAEEEEWSNCIIAITPANPPADPDLVEPIRPSDVIEGMDQGRPVSPGAFRKAREAAATRVKQATADHTRLVRLELEGRQVAPAGEAYCPVNPIE